MHCTTIGPMFNIRHSYRLSLTASTNTSFIHYFLYMYTMQKAFLPTMQEDLLQEMKEILLPILKQDAMATGLLATPFYRKCIPYCSQPQLSDLIYI